MRKEIFMYKGRRILYNTGEVQEDDEEPAKVGGSPEQDEEKEEPLSDAQMAVVLSSMSDNRISDSVKDAVAQAESSATGELTEEQRLIVEGSKSDNRISDSVKDLVEQNTN